jgi:hypothetical protein
VFDIDKIAKSIVDFSDYFSLRIILLLLSCYFVHRYAWSADYSAYAVRVHADLVSSLDALSKDKVLELLKPELITPFLFLFVLISLLDIHMKVLFFISRLFPFTFSLGFNGDYALASNELTLFNEWKKVSGIHDYYAYREMVIRDFYDSLAPGELGHVSGMIASLMHYLRPYGLIFLAVSILFPGLFVGSTRWHTLTMAFTLIFVSISAGLLEQLWNQIRNQPVRAYKLYKFVDRYNAQHNLPSIEDQEAIERAPPPKTKDDLGTFKYYVPSITVQMFLPMLYAQYDFQPLWMRIRSRLLRTKRAHRP